MLLNSFSAGISMGGQNVVAATRLVVPGSRTVRPGRSEGFLSDITQLSICSVRNRFKAAILQALFHSRFLSIRNSAMKSPYSMSVGHFVLTSTDVFLLLPLEFIIY